MSVAGENALHSSYAESQNVDKRSSDMGTFLKITMLFYLLNTPVLVMVKWLAFLDISKLVILRSIVCVFSNI